MAERLVKENRESRELSVSRRHCNDDAMRHILKAFGISNIKQVISNRRPSAETATFLIP
jgi:hypothetical protein